MEPLALLHPGGHKAKVFLHRVIFIITAGPFQPAEEAWGRAKSVRGFLHYWFSMIDQRCCAT